ncbi:MAG TPA: class I SAM-dependent methyltransferase [Streptosporangiaceae bacterium]
MIAYAKFAAFYDQIMGDRTVDVERVREYIRRYLPSAGSLLELGCGTGAVLAEFAPDLTTAGIDRSPDMLAVAAGRVPQARLVESDITAFDLGTKFDVVICVFDTLNHLPSFEAWLALFDRVHEHLAAGGIFAFDVNTVGRLRRLWQGPAFAQDFGGHTVIMDVAPGGGDLSLWQVRIFERLEGDQFRLHREVLTELGVPLDQIRQALAPRFDLLEETDLDHGPVSDDSNRVFFAYRRRAEDPD